MTDRPRERHSIYANIYGCVMTSKWLGHEKLSLSSDFAGSHGQVTSGRHQPGLFYKDWGTFFAFSALCPPCCKCTWQGAPQCYPQSSLHGEVGNPGLRLNKETALHIWPFSPVLHLANKGILLFKPNCTQNIPLKQKPWWVFKGIKAPQ